MRPCDGYKQTCYINQSNNITRGYKVFQKIRVQVEIDEIKYTKIQSLLQKEKVNPNDIKLMFEQMINNQFRRTNNIRG